MTTKKNMLGAGLTGILGAGAGRLAGAEPPRQAEAPAQRYSAGRGRPRRDEPNFGAGKTFEKTTIAFESGQYERVRELAYRKRMSFKEMVYHLIEEGLRKLDK